jgi:[acyl-carrier-protein] S-malonyltransferase
MNAFIFPGQGSQFPGMAHDLYQQSDAVQQLFNQANEILGFDITAIMFNGTDEQLKQTKVTQPAIFLHSIGVIVNMGNTFNPDMVAGHSLGEFSALVANKTLSFADALKLVSRRALAMQKACEEVPGTMAAILGMDDKMVEDICNEITSDVVVAANYNCPGQLVISGSIEGVTLACEKIKAAGAKRALLLPVGGAFHSPLMMPAQQELEAAIDATKFAIPICPIFQNVNAESVINPDTIKQNLIAQLTAPVKWTQTMQNMIAAGATNFYEAGPGKVLQGLVKKVNKDIEAQSV